VLKSDTRQQIMDATERLCQDRRFHEITLDEVAAVARVGKGTIYLYFKDKDDLFFQTATSGFDRLCELIRNGVREQASSGQQILQVCQEIHRFFRGRPQLSRMMQIEDGRLLRSQGRIRSLWMEKRKRLEHTLAAIIRRGVAEKEIRADIAPEALASILLGMLRTRALDLAARPNAQPPVELVADLFRHGAGAHRR
jgi:AcrR family transcriptional regulator